MSGKAGAACCSAACCGLVLLLLTSYHWDVLLWHLVWFHRKHLSTLKNWGQA